MGPAKSENAEDAFHRLPHPRERKPGAPFVGNETGDDNLCETAQVAAWTALGGRCHELNVTGKSGRVTLDGSVDSADQAQICAAAVRALPGVLEVTNKLVFPATTAGELRAKRGIPTAPLAAYVTHFCQLHAASVTAAIRSSLPTLEAIIGSHPSSRGFVVYRNRQPGAITVEVGFPVETRPVGNAAKDLSIGAVPAQPFLSAALADDEFATLLDAYDELCRRARELGEQPASYFWQELRHTAAGYVTVRNVHLPLAGADPHKETEK
jgi:hypothetical protein